MLAVGIAASTAVFSVVNAVVLKPVPFAEPDTLLQLGKTQDGRVTNDSTWRRPTSRFGARSNAFEDVAAYTDASVSYANGDVPERVAAKQVSEAYFRVFRAPLAAGRTFAREDDLPGAAPTVVLSHEFWQQRLGGDPGVLGTTISLAGTPHTVLGIAGAGFDLRELGRRGSVAAAWARSRHRGAGKLSAGCGAARRGCEPRAGPCAARG